MKIRLLDTSFAVLATISLLNINGAVTMAVGVGQAGSPLLLLASAILVAKLGAVRIPLSSSLLFVSILCYLLLALMFSITENPTGSSGHLSVAYSASLLILWAVVAYMQYANSCGRVDDTLRLLRNLSVIAAGTVLFSPVLYRVFEWVPPSGESRFGGFFGNPNEAGVMANVAMAFVLTVPYNRRWLQILALTGSSAAAILTFSKTAWMILPLVILLYLFLRSKRSLYWILVLLSVTLLIAFIDIVNVLEWLLNNPFIELTLSQELRIQQFKFLLSATWERENILTGREYLWQFGVQRILENPIGGSGLGTFHYLEGGLMQGGVWQGVHNVYLMIWGEAGFFAFVLFLVATIVIGYRVIFRSEHAIAVLLGLILFLNLLVNHNVLISRYFIVLIGVLISLQSRNRKVQESLPPFYGPATHKRGVQML
jgi:O-antigen ligase